MLRLKLWSARGESHHPAFAGKWSTIIRNFIALSTHCHWSSPSRKWERGVSLRFHLVVFVHGVSQENQEAEESKIRNTIGGKLLRRPSPMYKKLLGIVAFGIIYIASAKSRSAKGGSHQPAFMGSCLTMDCTCLTYLPSRWVSTGRSIKSYWTESHMEFYQTSTTELVSESMWNWFRWSSYW